MAKKIDASGDSELEQPKSRKLSRKKSLTPESEAETIVPKVGAENKGSFAPLAFVLAIVLVVTTIFSFLLPTKTTKNINVVGPLGITLTVDLSSSAFRDSYRSGATADYCNNPKEYPGISGSTAFFVDSTGKNLGSIKLGDATSYSYVSCKFRTFLPLEDNFNGGTVSVYVKFPFGESETFKVDVGSELPYKIALNLNLG
jgi:hypothetical protein